MKHIISKKKVKAALKCNNYHGIFIITLYKSTTYECKLVSNKKAPLQINLHNSYN